MSSNAVLIILTLDKGSSTHLTGISKIGYPFFSANIKSSVSKNQLSVVQSKDSLEDVIVEKAAVLV